MAVPGETPGAPPNRAARVQWNAVDGRLSLFYQGAAILEGLVRAETADGQRVSELGVRLETTESRSEAGKVEQVLTFRLSEPLAGSRVIFRGRVLGSEEAFAAETRFHPWVLSTTRHLSQGGVSLLDEEWDPDQLVLSGCSSVVVDDPYVLTVHLPDGFRATSAMVDGSPGQTEARDGTVALRLRPRVTGEVHWTIVFAQ
ncbi:MAG: hypothetical protein H7A46_02930 [Verrucomicrobiales bacterium]|nr:hypothetical protein [Verrucomicrobiales bacterium]